MKRVLLTVALCVAASASFAQKKVVSEAQSIAKNLDKRCVGKSGN